MAEQPLQESSSQIDRTRWSDGGVSISTYHAEHKHSREVSVRWSGLRGAPINIAVQGWNDETHLGAGENLSVDQACEIIAALSRLIGRAAEEAER